MQGMLCGCERRLRAANYEELIAEVIEHLRRDHPGIKVGEAGVRAVREIVAARSDERRHLVLPDVGAQAPPVYEEHGFSRAPIFVEQGCSIPGRDKRHRRDLPSQGC